jgi:hypothetical protein
MTARSCSFIAFAVCFLLLFSSPLGSQTSTAPAQKTPKPQVQAPAASLPGPAAAKTEAAPEIFKVSINSSRASVTRDGSYGVYADLENLSQLPVTIRSQETMLVVQPEVAYPAACVGVERGIFPAQPFSGDPAKSTEMTIQPKEHYKVFWNLTNTSGKVPQNPTASSGKDAPSKCSEDSWVKRARESLGFVPGDYAFTVEGIVYAPNAKAENIAHTYTETTTLHVGLSQVATAWAAFLGALLAYFVVALQPGRDFDQWKVRSEATAASASPSSFQRTRAALRGAAIVLRNALAAGLLGAALTIVASRLSDTQFPVKVSVSDFWGALTIGFISYFIGGRILATIIDRFAPPSKPDTTPGAGGPGVGKSGAGNPPANQPANTAAENPKPGVDVPEKGKYQEFDLEQTRQE